MSPRSAAPVALLACCLAFCSVVLSGCGLALDYGPPDSRDGGRADTGGSLDAGRTDSGVHTCRTERDCADADLCNGTELCVDGVCQAGDAVQCPDDDVCDGTAHCDATTGVCAQGTALICPTDNDPCNGVAHCDPVDGCVTGLPVSCDDGIACTADSCAGGACAHELDNTSCTVASGGVCTPSGCSYSNCIADVTCVSEDPCMRAACVGNMCLRTPISCSGGQVCCGGVCAPAGCDDREDCTLDTCDVLAGCIHAFRTGSCDDGDACTGTDHCAQGVCRGVARICPGMDACNVGICLVAGGCTTMPISGVHCSDGDPCTLNDMCAAGVCTSGVMTTSCGDANPCTTDTCDPSTGCSNVPVTNNAPCTNVGASGVCVGSHCETNCPLGMADCDNDGLCECIGICNRIDGVGLCIAATGTTCRSAADCTGLMTCCTHGARAGTCYLPACLACCS